MRESFIAFSVLLAGVAMGLGVAAEAAVQETEGREVCSPFEGRCLTVYSPSIPFGEAAGEFEIPRTRDGRPDFTGVWAGPGFDHQIGPGDTNAPIIRGFDGAKMAPLTPLGEEEMFVPFTGDLRIDDPIALCLPYGFTSQIFVPGYAQQWIQAPNHIVIRHEFMNNFTRVIYMDGGGHPEDPELTWGGHSIGSWEGDTLVIDTVGLKKWWLDNPHPMGSLWHSDELHVVERFEWVGPRVVAYDVVIDDPAYFTRPWSEQLDMVLHPNWELLEFVCNENDRCSGGTCDPADVQLDDAQ